MRLDALTKLQLVLSGAKTSLDCPVEIAYSDNLPNGLIPQAPAISATNGVTAVDVLAAPAAQSVVNTYRQLDEFNLVNVDTGAITVTISTVVGSTATKVIKTALAVGDQLCYNTQRGWYVLDSAGEMRGVSTTSIVASSAVPASASAAGVAGTIAFDATHIYVCIAANTWVRATTATW